MADNNGASQVPMAFIVPLGSMLALAFGGGWALMQSQFANVERSIDATRTQLTANLDRTVNDNLKLSNSVDVRVTEIHTELLHDVVRQNEFIQFEQRLDSVLKRLDIVEATRPTTGELKGTADGLSAQFATLNARVVQLESRAYEAARSAARNPVEAGELTVTISAIDKQLNVVQQQMADINRQIAAALLSIDPIKRPPQAPDIGGK